MICNYKRLEALTCIYPQLQTLEAYGYNNKKNQDFIVEFPRKAPNLTSLSFDELQKAWTITECSALISSLPLLVYLKINHVTCNTMEPTHFTTFDRLKSVELGVCYYIPLNFLTQIKCLTALNLFGGFDEHARRPFSIPDVSRVLSSCTSLEKLSCSSASDKSIRDQDSYHLHFPNLVNLKSIKELRMIGGGSREMEKSILGEVSGLANLRRLFLKNIRTAPDQFIKLFQTIVKDSPSVETLSIIKCRGLDEAGLKILTEMPCLHRLEIQHAVTNEISDYDFIGSCSQLRSIKININAEEEMPYIPFAEIDRILSRCTSLKEVDLSDHLLMDPAELEMAKLTLKRFSVVLLRDFAARPNMIKRRDALYEVRMQFHRLGSKWGAAMGY